MTAIPLLLFIFVPLAEIVAFIYVGDFIGIWATIALVILTAIIGTALLRMQGLAVLSNAQKAMQEGRIPVDSVIDGVCLLVAGAFLLTPGFITDSAGFLLFVPPFRRALASWLFERIIASQAGYFDISVSSFEHKDQQRSGDSTIIEGEFEHVEEENQQTEKQQEDSKKDAARSPWRRKTP